MGSGRERVRRTRAQWEQIVEQQAASGLSQAAFCERAQISPASFAHWRARLRSERTPAPFVEWRLEPPQGSALSAGELELVLPGGVRLRMRV